MMVGTIIFWLKDWRLKHQPLIGDLSRVFGTVGKQLLYTIAATALMTAVFGLLYLVGLLTGVDPFEIY